MNDYSIRSEFEAKTHELLDTYKGNVKDSNRIEAFAMMHAIKATWWGFHTSKRLVKIALVLSNDICSEANLRAELRRMVRAKVLRTRIEDGKKLYEVNY